jgi:RNA ligase
VKPYHKINTMFKRDMENGGKLIEGEWADPALEFLAQNVWEFTEKVDGTNIRVHWDGKGKVAFGGRSDNAQIPVVLLDRLTKLFRPYDGADCLYATFPDAEVTLYGEGYGPKIQKGGGNYGSSVDFVLFDVRIGDFWLRRDDVQDVGQKLGIGVVPVKRRGTLHDAIHLVKTGFTSYWGYFEAEGIVARPVVELYDRQGHRIITKIKARDFR